MSLRSILKGWFGTGDKPTAAQFGALIDTFYSKEEDTIPITAVDGLQTVLGGKADIAQVPNQAVNTNSTPTFDGLSSTGSIEGVTELQSDNSNKAASTAYVTTKLGGYQPKQNQSLNTGDWAFFDKVTGATNMNTPELNLSNSGHNVSLEAVTLTDDRVITAPDNSGQMALTSDINNTNITAGLGYVPENVADKNMANGYAGLDANGKLLASQYPAGIDQVIEYPGGVSSFPVTGSNTIIYFDTSISSGKQYRWSGSQYIPIIATPGTTDAVAEGNNNLYFTTGRVLATLLVGIGFSTVGAVVATDTILQAIGKLQAQITNIVGSFVPLSGATLTGPITVPGITVNGNSGTTLSKTTGGGAGSALLVKTYNGSGAVTPILDLQAVNSSTNEYNGYHIQGSTPATGAGNSDLYYGLSGLGGPIPVLHGSASTNTLIKYTDGFNNGQGNSQITDDGTTIGLGTTVKTIANKISIQNDQSGNNWFTLHSTKEPNSSTRVVIIEYNGTAFFGVTETGQVKIYDGGSGNSNATINNDGSASFNNGLTASQYQAATSTAKVLLQAGSLIMQQLSGGSPTGAYMSLSYSGLGVTATDWTGQYLKNTMVFDDIAHSRLFTLQIPSIATALNKTQTFQDKSGTIALTSDIPACPVLVASNNITASNWASICDYPVPGTTDASFQVSASMYNCSLLGNTVAVQVDYTNPAGNPQSEWLNYNPSGGALTHNVGANGLSIDAAMMPIEIRAKAGTTITLSVATSDISAPTYPGGTYSAVGRILLMPGA